MFLLAPQLTTPDDLGPVTIDVLMPAGLEPVDPNLSGGGARGCALGDVGNAAWKAVRSWWPICPTQETRPEAVQYHYQSMMAGTHTLEFMAVSVTEGLFILPSAKAFADNQAEVGCLNGFLIRWESKLMAPKQHLEPWTIMSLLHAETILAEHSNCLMRIAIGNASHLPRRVHMEGWALRKKRFGLGEHTSSSACNPTATQATTVVQLEANAAATKLSPGGHLTGFFCAAGFPFLTALAFACLAHCQEVLGGVLRFEPPSLGFGA
eukprot:1158700-Pelagomonas_calceolata.AAC.1